jgi:hypothetical protein
MKHFYVLKITNVEKVQQHKILCGKSNDVLHSRNHEEKRVTQLCNYYVIMYGSLTAGPMD